MLDFYVENLSQMESSETETFSLCKNYKVFYINGSGAQRVDIESNHRYISKQLFKEPYTSGRVELLYNSNTDYRKMADDTLEEVLEKLTDPETVKCPSEKISSVFIGHSFAATILKLALSEDVLSAAILKRSKNGLKPNRVVEMVNSIRSRVAVFSLGGTKWVPKNRAKVIKQNVLKMLRCNELLITVTT